MPKITQQVTAQIGLEPKQSDESKLLTTSIVPLKVNFPVNVTLQMSLSFVSSAFIDLWRATEPKERS